MLIPLPEQSIADVAARAGVSPEFISLIVWYVAPKLVSPLAAVWKRWKDTSGPDTRTIIKVLTALIVGVGGFALGLYGYDSRGLINAVFAAILTYFKTVGDYDREVQVQAKAARVTTPEPGPEPFRAATPDTEQPASADDVARLL